MKFKQDKKPTLKGSRLRSYAYAVLTRREYSKAEFTEKLLEYALHPEEVFALVEEFSEKNYQSDERVAQIVLSSQASRGKGPNRIRQTLQQKKIDSTHVEQDIQEVDWIAEAYKLKLKKFGEEIAVDPKQKAKQIRFLQYRGFDMGDILKVVTLKEDDFYN